MTQLTADCLYEILEYLEDDKFTLYSCILVNRFWCEIAVRIFWRNVCNYNTLISCLPNKSKEILYENGIFISTLNSKTPIFNYASFCKVLSINLVHYKIGELLRNQQNFSSQGLYNNKYIIVVQEIFKMFMNQISSLKSLVFLYYSNITFTLYPGAKDCLKNLTELRCNSNISSEFFYHLSQICYNIQSLNIKIEGIISNGLEDLISSQKNLKYFGIELFYYFTDKEFMNTIQLLMSKLPNTLIKLDLLGGYHCISLSFIINFKNLKELQLSFNLSENFEDFEILRYVVFPNLRILKLQHTRPKFELLINFLENNGKNLKELYVCEYSGCGDNSLNLAITKFCPNLLKLSTGIKNNELETLKLIFNNCKNLESIKIWCGDEYLSEKEALEMILKYSQNNLYELILYHLFDARFKLLPEELESFFKSWLNFKSQRSISLIIVNYDTNSLDTYHENIEIINKYIKLGVIKKFKVTDFGDEEFNVSPYFIS
ncbi:hypothetical protein RhiirA5_423748 [Rhizophagus irregularis]|uniref:F-box domain-containing protein n=2 Tax=Rhizophagus irregularis TaxID=588596 RepID=A0A2I1DTK0_9GLOM|nr:hypothetical protein RirG_004800 [Rhizophagus irregularis DAOM 197198w]PKC03451.1 hypothetical protein RhiirA5_423748 [Rhizophagus irregularis]PKK68336.1 hypothetical protein RhiirC2_782367 [Rhizophagus irregularis]PKY13197.1 hypothetical protein RhiirB3_424967 [Rhizophagus irregularis]UZO24609.1 hypothetical protein OCT59_016905 [Rhizophagus irregularis]